MKDWNVVVSVFQGGFRRALRALQKLGVAERSPYHNVLVMKVEDPVILLEAFTTRSHGWHRPHATSTSFLKRNSWRERNP